jgi:hypothetical protein
MRIQACISPALGAIHNFIQIHDLGEINDFTYEDNIDDRIWKGHYHVSMAKTTAKIRTKNNYIDLQSGTFKLVHHPCLPQSFVLELHIGVCHSNVRVEEVEKCDELSVSQFHFYFLCRSNGMTLAEG